MDKNEHGIWLVKGEDQSTGDRFDQPRIPVLGYFEGTYEAVLKHAQTWKKWKSWGKGGTITKTEMIEIPIQIVNKKGNIEQDKQYSIRSIKP